MNDFAKKKNLLPKHLSALIILGLIHLINQDYFKSHENFIQAEFIARKIKLFNKINIINMGLYLSSGINTDALVQKGNLTAKSQDLFLSLILDQLQITDESLEQVNFSKLQPDALSLVVYRIDDKLGVIVHDSDNTDPNDRELQGDLMYCGNLYATALGQGQNYHEGLFGPLPFGKQQMRGLIFTKIFHTPENLNSRNKDKSYFLFVLIFPQEFSRVFSNQNLMEPIFIEEIGKITSIAQITKQWLQNFKRNIIQNFDTHFIEA
jgi:hypothetical protein